MRGAASGRYEARIAGMRVFRRNPARIETLDPKTGRVLRTEHQDRPVSLFDQLRRWLGV